MKKSHHLKLFAIALLCACGSASLSAQDLHVRADGGPTLAEAFRAAREMRRADSLGTLGTLTIQLERGIHRLKEPLVIRPEDRDIVVRGRDGAVVSGGIAITGWKREGKLWVAQVPDFNGRALEFRQLWVNGRKAVRARDVADFEQMHRIRSVDKQRRELWVPSEAVKKIRKAPHAEMVLHEMWCVSVLRIASLRIEGDSAAVIFHEPERRIQFEHPWPTPMVTTDGRNSAFYLTNAKELLDEPGEWYLDLATHKVYYYPLAGEDLRTAEVTAPMLETLVRIAGTADTPVSGIRFEGVTFSHTTWRRPSFEGHVPLQAGMYLTDAYKLRPQMVRRDNHKLDNQGWLGRAAAAIACSWCENVFFEGCDLRHLGGSGLDFEEGVHHSGAQRCTLQDIGMNGIVAGSFSPAPHETHKPYRPSDLREVCSGLTISDCLIDDVTNDDWGCVGIAAGYVAETTIAHNEIREVSYTGISLGWGWNRDLVCMHDNRVEGNLIHHYAKHMYDVAGIYTLGNQPGTLIEGNVVRDIYTPGYAHDPHHWFYLYTDEGSSNITLRNNWTPEEKYLQNANGPGNLWEHNGPMVDDSIRQRAGIRP